MGGQKKDTTNNAKVLTLGPSLMAETLRGEAGLQHGGGGRRRQAERFCEGLGSFAPPALSRQLQPAQDTRGCSPLHSKQGRTVVAQEFRGGARLQMYVSCCANVNRGRTALRVACPGKPWPPPSWRLSGRRRMVVTRITRRP